MAATPPSWSVAPALVAYRWQRCTRSHCVAIRGANGLRLSTAHGTVRVVAIATFDDGTRLRAVSRKVPG